ncbi:putative ABC transport system ATP-binding protein [Methanococcus voltae]|uniref:ABC transport system ATP-binding protein n=2 Tax=Methanococcus voltae TaxID=2188 RepID=A0ABT2EV48_METVO|nr:ABC transporter ATP-binding protein [Methanococcus voltae]MBP2171939.1 putative ABC transport system ATP-binding protein [Methanococcus voltae]MBP2201106.1 putative ABC transport system ATP-binding protein [Methanococcus voltae]MCS3921829.1 putative ABC transport system ATP-binding protein [Methanococcus voltae PS]
MESDTIEKETNKEQGLKNNFNNSQHDGELYTEREYCKKILDVSYNPYEGFHPATEKDDEGKKVFIDAKKICRIFGTDVKTKVLDDVNLKIYEKEFVMILGPSGCGKTTLMNILGLLDTPSSGKLYISNNLTVNMAESERAVFRRKIGGFIFQQFHLINTLTALQNVELPMVLDNLETDTRTQRAMKLLNLVGLKGKENNRPSQLSGGQQQRVAIARALSNKPKILFADEPTGNLDSVSGKQVMKLIKELHDQGITIIMVTHDSTLLKYATKVIRMKDGQIEQLLQRDE